MATLVDVSEDDDSLSEIIIAQETIVISDDENTFASMDAEFTSDDEELPSVEIQTKKSATIRNLFSKTIQKVIVNKSVIVEKVSDVAPSTSTFIPIVKEPKDPGVNKMIEGVKVNLPVNPYGSQVALMSMLIKAIKRGQNCLLESPTGSGKTLALLCGALAWLTTEKTTLSEKQALQYFADHPDFNKIDGALEYVSSPMRNPGTPEKLFSKNSFGEKSIYDKPLNNDNGGSMNAKRQEPQSSFEEDSPIEGQVTIHKKRKLEATDSTDKSNNWNPTKRFTTPEKKPELPDGDSPTQLRNLIDNLHIRTSMLVNCSVPTIYYGARTHKQLEQVIKEFGRTSYSDVATMSILSSRDYSCIREFDKKMWGTKNEMCKGCVRKIKPKDNTPRTRDQTNCKYYDNRLALNHSRLAGAFDLEDLKNAGHELTACPYFAAREMASAADIVFCPYNYLIDPSIRRSMRINLENNILIIDEAHNIEDICRDTATFTFTREQIQSALKELGVTAEYRYASSHDVMTDIDKIIVILKNWDDWFFNQSRLLENKPFNNNEVVYEWQSEHFAKSLNNHNIGITNYSDFKQCVENFCAKLQNEPGSLYGVTQNTGNLLENLDSALGYLFRDNCKYMDDYKPLLVKTVTGDFEGAHSWRASQFNRSVETETVSLRLICMNPAIVFESLKKAKCIVLASGTLTPLISLHSELGTEFPLKISPSHVIPSDRVWIGTLTTHRNGNRLECKSKDTNDITTQDTIGESILWVTQVTPHGVLCFLPSYQLLNKLLKRWQETQVWKKLNQQKHVFIENRNVRDHNDIMEDYYKYVATEKGALLFAVYRGKVSEGMDFKDHQARAVVTIGIPYPNMFDMSVKAKMQFNDKYSKDRKLLTGQEWLKVQAYRALNQAVGRCVRHKHDWGAVLLIDARFQTRHFTEHLSKWVVNFLEHNHHTFDSLINSANSLETFMQNMKIRESEDS